jgi:guanine deaminase
LKYSKIQDQPALINKKPFSYLWNMEEINLITRAIELATKNVNIGGGPFGAVIVKDGEIIAEGVNRVTGSNDPTAHAELQAIRKACKKLNNYDLSGCEIYSSCEPCPMCFSAIYWAHIDKVFYAATCTEANNAGFKDALIYHEIKLDPGNRSVPFIRIEHQNGNTPFEAWLAKEDKKKY